MTLSFLCFQIYFRITIFFYFLKFSCNFSSAFHRTMNILTVSKCCCLGLKTGGLIIGYIEMITLLSLGVAYFILDPRFVRPLAAILILFGSYCVLFEDFSTTKKKSFLIIKVLSQLRKFNLFMVLTRFVHYYADSSFILNAVFF